MSDVSVKFSRYDTVDYLKIEADITAYLGYPENLVDQGVK